MTQTPTTQDAGLLENVTTLLRTIKEQLPKHMWDCTVRDSWLARAVRCTDAALADRLEALSQPSPAPQGEAVAWRWRWNEREAWNVSTDARLAAMRMQTAKSPTSSIVVQPLYASPTPAEPGLRLVPVEPTDLMASEGESAASYGIGKAEDDEAIRRVWRAMLAAAPARGEG